MIVFKAHIFGIYLHAVDTTYLKNRVIWWLPRLIFKHLNNSENIEKPILI